VDLPTCGASESRESQREFWQFGTERVDLEINGCDLNSRQKFAVYATSSEKPEVLMATEASGVYVTTFEGMDADTIISAPESGFQPEQWGPKMVDSDSMSWQVTSKCYRLTSADPVEVVRDTKKGTGELKIKKWSPASLVGSLVYDLRHTRKKEQLRPTISDEFELLLKSEKCYQEKFSQEVGATMLHTITLKPGEILDFSALPYSSTIDQKPVPGTMVKMTVELPEPLSSGNVYERCLVWPGGDIKITDCSSEVSSSDDEIAFSLTYEDLVQDFEGFLGDTTVPFFPPETDLEDFWDELQPELACMSAVIVIKFEGKFSTPNDELYEHWLEEDASLGAYWDIQVRKEASPAP